MQSKSNKTLTKIAVAMSGGVDSSVAAAFCVKKYGQQNVIGLTMKLFDDELTSQTDAKNVCDQLGIKHYIIDLRKEFKKEVIEYFLAEYKKGHTPNPCIKCNKFIKFGRLFDEAKNLGAQKLATGHYVRIKNNKLLKGKDREKDQSYFLNGIMAKDISSILFPIGDLEKNKVRDYAKKIGLKIAHKKESQEICFISGKNEEYLSSRIKSKPGEIVNLDGKKSGIHKGIFYYTIGQRKGVGGGSEKPSYVIEINSPSNKIIIGEEKDLYKKTLFVKNINWLVDVKFPLKCTAKIRYRMKDEKCILNDMGEVIFRKPQRAITPGQSIVFYKGNIVLGGGVIDSL